MKITAQKPATSPVRQTQELEKTYPLNTFRGETKRELIELIKSLLAKKTTKLHITIVIEGGVVVETYLSKPNEKTLPQYLSSDGKFWYHIEDHDC